MLKRAVCLHSVKETPYRFTPASSMMPPLCSRPTTTVQYATTDTGMNQVYSTGKAMITAGVCVLQAKTPTHIRLTKCATSRTRSRRNVTIWWHLPHSTATPSGSGQTTTTPRVGNGKTSPESTTIQAARRTHPCKSVTIRRLRPTSPIKTKLTATTRLRWKT